MNAKLLAVVALPLIALGACSQSDVVLPDAGMGGAVGTGGATATPGVGGATAGGAGGTQGTATGGTSGGGSGGATGGGTGGSGTGTGGSVAGTGGATGAGGAALTSVVGNWDGALVTFPCGGTGTGYDCANLGCINNTVTKTTTFPIAGTAGTVYNVTLRIRGIVEAYAYVGGVRDAGNASITANKDLFQQGGAPQAAGGANYDYNTYEVDVTPPVAGKPTVYFLNSVTNAEGPHAANTPTSHLTFPIDYTKTISVTGGGSVTLKVFDSNCTLVQNCGPTATSNVCTAPASVSLAGAMPVSTLQQPFQMPVGRFGQWVHFDVTNVVAVGP
jgi:hypothetical protein